jgi:hypothetical protein
MKTGKMAIVSMNAPLRLISPIICALASVLRVRAQNAALPLPGERIAWRFGLHTAILNNRDNYSVINEYGVHTGFGLPFDTNFSSFDLGIEVGVRGDKDINLARETYVRLSFSLSTGERWFTGFDD